MVTPKSLRLLSAFAVASAYMLVASNSALASILNVPNGYATIQVGIDAASPGDTVLVLPGVYVENVSIAKDITLASNTLITGDNSYVSQTVINGNQHGTVVLIANCVATVSGFTILNGTGTAEYNGTYGGGVLGINSAFTLENLVVVDNYANSGGGISAVTSTMVVRNSVVAWNKACWGGGINLHHAPATLEHVTIVHNSLDFAAGFSQMGGGFFFGMSPATFVNTLIYDNENAEIASWTGWERSSAVISYSDIEGGLDGIETNGWLDVTWGEGNIDQAPQLADPLNADFRLANGSPCFNTGDPNSANDPDGSRADIGAWNLYGVRHHRTILNVPTEYASIQSAVDAAIPGDTVLVQPGMYVENISIDKNIVVGGLALTTGDLSYVGQTIIDGNQSGPVVTISYTEAKVEGFTIQHGSTNWYGGGIYVLTSNVQLEDLIVWDNFSSGDGSGIAIYWQSHAEVKNVLLAFNTESGADGTGVFGVWVLSDANLTNVTIAHNFARVPTQAGIYLTEDAEISVTNSIVRNPDMVQMRLAPYWTFARGSVAYSDFLGGSDAVIVHEQGEGELTWGDGNIDSDALFRDPRGGDFRLVPGSPCIDSGDPNSPADADGSRADMGARLWGHREYHHTILNVPAEYATIQSAVNAAIASDTVLIQPGTYTENVTIAKNIVVGGLTLITDDPQYAGQTIIDGDRQGSTVAFSGCSATLVGLKLVGGSGTPLGLGANTWGGGILSLNSSTTLRDLILQCNDADEGGGLCSYNGELTARNLLVIYNTAVWGGGINLHFTNATFSNLTIEKNSIDYTRFNRQMGGGLILGASTASLSNSIIRDNDHDEVTLWVENRPNHLVVNYSDIRGGEAKINIPNGNGDVVWGEGNLDAYPVYINRDQGDFRLAEGSPCIDAGDPNSPNDRDGSPSDIGEVGLMGNGRCELPTPFGHGVERAQPDSFSIRTYGAVAYEGAQAIVQTADGFAIAGWATDLNGLGLGYYDFWLVKVDTHGDTLWTRRYGGQGVEMCWDMIQTSDGGFALAGSTSSFGAGGTDMWLVRTDSDGQELWSRSYGLEADEIAYSLVQTDDGGFALAGVTSSFDFQPGPNGHEDYWLLRTNANGDSLWSQKYGGNLTDVATKVVKTIDGGFTMAGASNSFGLGTYASWMIHVSEVGDSLWARRVGPQGSHNSCSSLLQTEDGGYLLAGDMGLAAGSNGYLIRTDPHGETIWQNVYGNPSDWDAFRAAVAMEDGGFVLAGASTPLNDGNVDFWLLRVNYRGECIWQRTTNFGTWDCATALTRTRDGGFAYVGAADQGYGGTYDYGFIYTGPEVEDAVRHGNIAVLPDTLDFGNIQWGASSKSCVVIENQGTGARQIRTWIDPWGGFFYTPDSQRIVGPNRSDTVFVWGNYWVNYFPGHYEQTLSWTSDCGEVHSLLLMANITAGGGGVEEPLPEVDEDSLTFGMVPPGQQAVRRLHFHNPTGDTIRFRARIVGGGGMFACPEDSEYVIPPGAGGGVSIIVTFNPTGGGGAGGYVDTLVWTAGGGGGTEYRIPLQGGIGGGWGEWVTTIGDGGPGYGGGLIKIPDGYTVGGGSGPTEREKRFWGGGTDSRGRPIWGRNYGGGGGRAMPIIKRRGGGYVLGGIVDTLDEGGGSDWLVVLDEQGDSLWSRMCGCHGHIRSRITGIGETTQEELITVGDFVGDGPDGQEIFIDKIGPNGEEISSRTFGGPGDDEAVGIVPSIDGGFVVVGSTHPGGDGDADIWVIKLDPTGNPVWSKTYGSPDDETAGGAVATPIDGGIAIVGTSRDAGTGDTDILLVKISVDGDSLWAKSIGGTTPETGVAVTPTWDDGLMIVATTLPSNSSLPDILAIRTDENGDSLWAQPYGGDLEDVPTAVVPDDDGGVVIAGDTKSFGAGDADILLFKINPDIGAGADVTVSPDSVGFGRVCLGQGARRVVHFTNESALTLRLKTFISEGVVFESPVQVQTILPGGTVSVTVSIPHHPPVGGGFYSYDLVWYVQPGDVHRIPLTATLNARPIPVHFTDVVETLYDESILVTETTVNGQPIEPGSEIGVFTTAGLLSGVGVKLEGLPVGLPAWGDDPDTAPIDGFVDGEVMSFRVWDVVTEIEYAANATIEEGSIHWQQDGLTALSLVTVEFRTMPLVMTRGWNLISVNVIPPQRYWICEDGPDIELMMDQFIDAESGHNHVILLKDERGRFYWPQRRYNGIPNWSLTEGYHVKVDSTVSGSWTGEPIPAGADVPIQQGWNIIAYYPTYPLAATSPGFYVLSPILDYVIIAKNRTGNFLRPASHFSNMPPWRESQAYQIKVSQDVILNYPEAMNNFGSVEGEPEESQGEIWTEPASTGANMSLLISRFTGGIVADGDQIAAFDADGRIVGVGTVRGGVCGLAVWGDDVSTNAKDGLSEQEGFSLKLGKRDSKGIHSLSITRVEVGEGLTYRTDGMTSLEAAFAEELPTAYYLAENYPNPFNAATTLRFGLPEDVQVSLKVFDLSGREVATLVDGPVKAGAHLATWDAAAQTSGIYIVRMQTPTFSQVRKVTLVR